MSIDINGKEQIQRHFRTPGAKLDSNIRASNGRLDSGHVVIGVGTIMRGEISNCTLLEILGHADGDFKADRVVVHNGGELHGRIDTAEATVSGILEGTVTVENKLDIRETGAASGELAYGQLSVEPGGSMTGTIAVTSANEPTAALPVQAAALSEAKPTRDAQPVPEPCATSSAPSLLGRLAPGPKTAIEKKSVLPN
jgi:cytoskeletal protein CcmA (bactofilin family)